MAIILRLQNLPWSANSLDIRRYFQGLSIPEGGVHIVGGEKGDAFIAFSTDEDARQAMERDGGKVKEIKIKLMLSSRVEMQRVIEQARSQCTPAQLITLPPSKPKEKEKSRTPERSRKGSPDRKRERDRSPRDRDRDKNNSRKSSSSSSRKDRSRSRSPSRRNRDRDRDRDSDRRSKRSDDRRKSDDTQKSRDDSSRHDNNNDNRSSAQLSMVSGNKDSPNFGLSRQNATRISDVDAGFVNSFIPTKQQSAIDPWIDKIPVWDEVRQVMVERNKPDGFRPGMQSDFMSRDPFGRVGDTMKPVNAISRHDTENERGRIGLPPAFESGSIPRRQIETYVDNGVGFTKQPDESIGNSFRSFDSDQRILPSHSQMMGGKQRPGFEDESYPPNPPRVVGFCIEVKGLPISVSYKDIRDLFRGIFISSDGLKLINDENGQRSGTALIRLTNQRDVTEALKRNRQFVGDSYIDVFRCTDNVFEQAVDSYLPPGMKKQLHMQPRPNDLVVLLRGLPYSCKEDDIINFFDGLRILDLHIEHDFNGRTTGSAYVEFGTPDDYHAAMSMNRRTLGHRYVELTMGSKEMMLASRTPKQAVDIQPNLPLIERDRMPAKELLPLPQQENRPSFCVALQGLPFQITDRDIADFFADVGVPLAMHIMLNPDRTPTGEAFVEYGTAQQFELALNKSGNFMGPNMIKVLSIPYDEMMEVLGNPIGKTDPLLNRPPLNDSRGKIPLDEPEIIPLPRPMMKNNRPRPPIREMDESNSPRLGMGDPGRGFNGPLRDSIQHRGFPSESQENIPHRGGFSDGPGFRGPQDHRDGPLPSRNYPGESRNFGGRPFMDGPDRPRGFQGDDNDMKPRGIVGDERNVRTGGRMSDPEDMGRNRRIPDDLINKGRPNDSPDSRMRGPMDRPDMKGGVRQNLGPAPNRDMPPQEGRMHRVPPNVGGPGPIDRRRMMPPGGGPNGNPGPPECFNKPGCVVGAANIPYRATTEEVLTIFKDFGLTKENILRRFDNFGRVTGDARIAFHSPDDAKKVIAELNGTVLSGRPISLFVA